MSVTVTIPMPQELVNTLQTRAQTRRLSLPELIMDLLTKALAWERDDEPTLEDVVAEIIALGPDPDNFYPAQGSLEEALANAPEDPTFDLGEWQREWAMVEVEMKAITRANDLAEGRNQSDPARRAELG